MIDEDGVAMEKTGVTWSPGLLLSENVDPGHKDNEQVCGTDPDNSLVKVIPISNKILVQKAGCFGEGLV